MLSFNGKILKVTRDGFEKRHDFVPSGSTSFSYCGVAPLNSSESDSVWYITRVQIAQDGTVDNKTASNVAWTNRTSVTYS
jgi:hypothetical protein